METEVWSLTGDKGKDRSFLVRSREHRNKWLANRNLTSFCHRETKICTKSHYNSLYSFQE